MKRILLLFLLITSFNIVNAQFKSIAEGPAFKEPEKGWAKILQMKNGDTFFLCINSVSDIGIRIYNATHQETSVTNIDPNLGKVKLYTISSVFEIKGDVVLMLFCHESRVPELYRVIIDGKTGSLKSSEKIGQLDKFTFGDGYAVIYGDVPVPGFFVRKDPLSDNYAAVYFNSFESDRSKRIEIVTYGSDNKEVSRAYYASPQEKYKYLQYIDMAVIGSDKVCVLAYGSNKEKNSDSELIMANLDKGATAVSFTELGFEKDMRINNGIVRYSPATKSLILAAVSQNKKGGNEYTPLLAFVDPYRRKIDRSDIISPSDRINTIWKKGFNGLPQDLFINDDGTFSIVYEEMTISSYSYSIATILGNMAVATYSKTGEFITDYFIRKSHFLDEVKLEPFYLSLREGTAQQLDKGNQYKSFAYLSGPNGNYILFNDTERNNDALEKGGWVTIKGVSESDGFYYSLKGTDPIPKRDYVFGNPEKKRDHNLGLFAISDYDRKSNTYVTLELSKESGKKTVQVVWLQPQ